MPGFILLSHPVHEAITDVEMRAALDDPGAPVIPVRIEPARLTLEETLHADWSALQRKQVELVAARLKPLLDEHPDYAIAYFGLAPIPLAVHLGNTIDRWRSSTVYQRHHTARGWRWSPDDPIARVGVTVRDLPQDVVRSEDDVVVRVSVTARVDANETAKIAPTGSTEIDIEVAEPGEDVLKGQADLETVAARFKEVLDRLETHRPNARRIHLFAAVPVGLAYRLGTLVSATRHHRVQTYQYFRAADPRYQRAILLGDDARRVRELTGEERAAACTMRQVWANDLVRVRGFSERVADQTKRAKKSPWFELVLPRETENASFDRAWQVLARFHETPMRDAPIDVETSSVADDFRFDTSRGVWLLGDELLTAIGRRLPSSDLLRAGRMLLFHEALHVHSHRLTDATAPAIRRFPKILEEVDYQADVWAMIHEFAFTRHYHPDPASSDRDVFIEIVRTAVDTMWAFDDGHNELEEMELRRVNRYLIWYWQWLCIERCSSLAAVLAVLARKPLIELAGPRVHTDGDRVFYELREPWRTDLELAALLEHNGISRHGQSAATSVPSLIEGLRIRNGEKIRLVLKSLLDQEVPRP